MDVVLHGLIGVLGARIILSELPAAAVTNDHTLGGLKQQKLILSQFWKPETQNPGVSGPVAVSPQPLPQWAHGLLFSIESPSAPLL